MHLFVISSHIRCLFATIVDKKKEIKFARPFSIEGFSLECWNSIQNSVFNHCFYVSSFKKIGSKLAPWKCCRFFFRPCGRCDVITAAILLKTQTRITSSFETKCGRFGQNRPGSFVKLARTDRQKDRQIDSQSVRQTHTQTLAVFFPKTITIHLVNEMTACENDLTFSLIIVIIISRSSPSPFPPSPSPYSVC